MVSRLNQLPPPVRQDSAILAEKKRKAEFDGLIKQLRPLVETLQQTRKRVVEAIEKYLKNRPRGDRDKQITLIASALGKSPRTLYYWLSDEADPEKKAARLATDREAKAARTPLDTRESLVQALNEHLETSNGDIEEVLKVIRNSPIPREKLCKTFCKEQSEGKTRNGE